jgi:type II secretory pathway component PulF
VIMLFVIIFVFVLMFVAHRFIIPSSRSSCASLNMRLSGNPAAA